MKSEDLLQDQFSSLLVSFGHLPKPIYHCQDGGMFVGHWETVNKVQGDVRPGPMGHRQRLQETSGSLLR